MQHQAPRVFGLCLVKDEADIIEQSLRHATAFCERIFVMDNGSTDGTVAIVDSLVNTGLPIVLSLRNDGVYYRGMRQELFEKHRRESDTDDWWLILDADEFLLQDPRPFLFRAAVAGETLVYTRQLEFAYTRSDLAAWTDGRETLDDRRRPIIDRRRFYRAVNFEPRLFQTRAPRAWSRHRNTPWVSGCVSRQVLLNLHFPNRDPEQIARRLLIRRHVQSVVAARGERSFHHIVSGDVADYVKDEADLHSVDLNGVPLFVEDFRPLPFSRSETISYLKWLVLKLLKRVE